jgi:hypothetical protein
MLSEDGGKRTQSHADLQCGRGSCNHDLSGIVKVIERAGYRARPLSSEDGNLDRVLAEPADLIAVGVGDEDSAQSKNGRTPTCHPAPRHGNNIAAATLGFGGSLEAVVGSWETGKLRPFHRLTVEGPWGRWCVVEGIGFGCIEQAIDPIELRIASPRQVQEWLARSVLTSTAEALDVSLGSETLSGRFVLLEITNVPFVGPRLHLVPMADPSNALVHASFLRIE